MRLAACTGRDVGRRKGGRRAGAVVVLAYYSASA